MRSTLKKDVAASRSFISKVRSNIFDLIYRSIKEWNLIIKTSGITSAAKENAVNLYCGRIVDYLSTRPPFK